MREKSRCRLVEVDVVETEFHIFPSRRKRVVTKKFQCFPPGTPKLFFTAKDPTTGFVARGISGMVLTDVQKVTLSVQPLDGAGNPAPVDGAPVWASSDETLVTLAVAADGLSAVATAVGPLGHVQVSCSADAQIGDGVTTITGTLEIDVVASQATTLAISAGAPEPK